MGQLQKKNENKEENIQLTPEKIGGLENEIKKLINNQRQNIFHIFNKNDYKPKNIGYSIDANDKILKNENLDSPHDYVIQWSIEGDNDINNTNCHLTFFNIGALLGGEGILYSICLFYYYFMKIPCENRKAEEIKKDIEKCLNYIDNGNIYDLNLIWKVNLNDGLLSNLRTAKDFLINLFQEKITNDLFEKLNDTLLHKIFKFFNSIKKGVSTFFPLIWYFFSGKLETKRKEEADYLKRKNKINKNHLPKLIVDKINIDFFANNNIFILATDDNTTPLVNYGIAFMGDYIEGLGEKHRARKLIEGITDGFITGNQENKKVYDFYYQKIYDIKLFFYRNQDKIDKINRGIDIDISIQGISKELNYLNDKYLKEGILENNSSRISTRETISQQMGDERAQEFIRLASGRNSSNISEISHIKENNSIEINTNHIIYNVENEKEKELIYA